MQAKFSIAREARAVALAPAMMEEVAAPLMLYGGVYRRPVSEADGLERFRRGYGAAAEAYVAVVKNNPLPRRDRTLRLKKADMDAQIPAGYRHGLIRLPVAELGRTGEFTSRRRAGDPVNARRDERERK